MIRVLLVDDEPLVLIGMQSMLNWSEQGCELVGTARNGAEALEKIGTLHPDIVISDIRMPVMDGLQLAEKSHEVYGSLPVFIVLTSYEEFDYVRRCMGFGAVDYLVKIDLTTDTLCSALTRAKEAIEKENAVRTPSPAVNGSLESYRERFSSSFITAPFPAKQKLHSIAPSWA